MGQILKFDLSRGRWLDHAIAIAGRLLPRQLRHDLYRFLVNHEPPPVEGVVVKLAESETEFLEAFSLLSARERSLGHAPVGDHHATMWHPLPTSRVVVLKHAGKVMATVTVVKDSPLGLPIDATHDIATIRRRGTRLAQITSLALSPDWQFGARSALLPLFKYIYEFSVRCFGVDTVICTLPAKYGEMASATLFFNPLDHVPMTENTRGPASAGMWLDLRHAFKQFAAHYSSTNRRGGLFRYFAERRLPTHDYPDRRRFKTPEPAFSPALLDQLFNKAVPIFNGLSERQKEMISIAFDQKAYGHVLPKCAASSKYREMRREGRHRCDIEGRIVISKSTIVTMHLIDASAGGFRAWLQDTLRFGMEIRASVALDNGEIADLECQPIWTDDKLVYGFSIQGASANWLAYIERLRLRDQAALFEKAGIPASEAAVNGTEETAMHS